MAKRSLINLTHILCKIEKLKKIFSFLVFLVLYHLKDLDSFFANTITSSSLTASESGSEDNNTEEIDDNQYTHVHLAATAEDFLMPPKRARTTGGPSRNSNQWKDEPNIVKQIQFTADSGLKINMESKKPLDFFRLFVTEELINTMVVETNR